MHVRNFTLLLFTALVFAFPARAQNFCPTNVGFESGSFTNWLLYTGYCCPIVANTLSGQVNNRHMITSGSGTDYYGGFPIVDPGGGTHSMKLGNSNTGSQAEKARYRVHVPTGVNNYSLIYRYAVVFEDPNHLPVEQPRFEVKAFDSATNTILPCAQFTYISTSNLPGFQVSTVANDVLYKSWTTSTLNLSGWGGHTIIVEFATGDCALGAHFGYGYVDVSCGLFQISGFSCGDPTTTFTAPPGFQTYTWMDSSYSTVVGSGQVVTINTPSVTSTYHVILTPYSGFGCPDTLTTVLNISNLQVNGTPDTTICYGSSITLTSGVSGNMAPFTYSWTPSTGLSCTTCANPVATTTSNTTYYVTVTDSNGCTKLDTIQVNVGTFTGVNTTTQNASCSNSSNGTIIASPVGGTGPFTYTWNSNPVQTTQTATNLGPGTYIVTVTDNLGCTRYDTATITAPPALVATAGNTNVNCYGQTNGSATVTATGGTPPYTYSWNSNPVQTTQTATNLGAGTYTATVTDANGCTATASTAINQPSLLNAAISTTTNALCGGTGSASVSVMGGSPGYTYSWSTMPVQTTTTATNLTAGTYTVTVTDAHGCSDTAIATISQSSSLAVTLTSTNTTCAGTSNGSITAAVTGGTLPYTYTWNTQPVQTSQTATNLSPGTYTVIVTDNSGCTQTVSASITSPLALTSNISNNPITCNGQNNGTATANANGGTQPYSYTWSTNPVQTSQTATNLTAGSVTVTVTDANGCTTNATTNITQPTALNAYISYSNSPICSNSSGIATVTAIGGTAPYTYSWNSNPVQTTATATGLPNGTYVATVTDANGCTDTAVVTISLSPALTLVMSSTNITCNGLSNGSASVSVNTGTPPYTYTWSNAQTGTSISNLGVGTYMITVTDNSGCTGNASVNITHPNKLNAEITNFSNVSCNGLGNGTASIGVAGGTGPYSFHWNTNPVQTTSQATNLAAGSYGAIITDAHGCTDSVSITITEPTPLDVTIDPPTDAICGLSNGSATAIAAGGTSPYTYSWNTNPVQTTATATSLLGGTYTVVVTDHKGCTDNATVTIAQSPAVYASAAPTDVTCNGLNNGSITAAITGGTQPFSYSWNIAQTGMTINSLNPGTYTFMVTDANGCADSSSATITEPAALATSATAQNIACHGEQTGAATISVSGGTQPYTYLWNNGGTSAAPTNMNEGTYTVVVTDAKGCTVSETVQITQPAELVLAANALNNTCINEATGAGTAAVSGGTAPYNVAWSTTPVQTGLDVHNLAPGSYTITVTDANGCIKTASINIDGFPLPNVDAGPDRTICYGIDSTTLKATGASTYTWTPANLVACSNCPVTSAYPDNTTTFEVTGIDENGCRDADQVTITVITNQPASVGEDVHICKGNTAQLSVSGGTDYVWTPSVVGYESSSNAPIVKPDSTVTYTVVVTKNICFTDTLTQTVVVHEQPTIDLGPDMKVLPGALVRLHAATTNAENITWEPSSALSCEDCFDPTATIDNTITFTATVFNNVCKAVDDITLTVSCDGSNIFLANSFTPNNDGVNDMFFPQTPGMDRIKLFRVYNRWGQVLHEVSNFPSSDPKFGWDGTFNGNPLPPDVYVYYLETSCPDGEKLFKKGDISLLK